MIDLRIFHGGGGCGRISVAVDFLRGDVDSYDSAGTADTAALAGEIRAGGYAGPLIIGEDLMRLELPGRMLRWNGATIGF